MVKVTIDGKEVEVEFRKLTWGEANDILKKVIKMKLYGNTTQSEIDFTAYRELLLQKSIKSPEWLRDISKIRTLPIETGEKLFNEAQKVNNLFPEQGEDKKGD